jgi:DNA-binding NtrC family response regulator
MQRFERHGVTDGEHPLPLAIFPDLRVETRPLGVLVVEDDPLLRWALAETLTLAGHHVIEAADVASAERGFHDAVNPIDIVLFDSDLPDLSRRDLLASIRALADGRAVVMMTDDAAPAVAIEAAECGVHAVVGKPFEMSSIERILRNACRSSRCEPVAVSTNQAG